MNRLAMSPAAAGLVRALIARTGGVRDRILLTEAWSTDWQSLTFLGERHKLQLRLIGPDCEQLVERLCSGLEEAELSLSGQIVADIALVGQPSTQADGSILVTIEALTVDE